MAEHRSSSKSVIRRLPRGDVPARNPRLSNFWGCIGLSLIALVGLVWLIGLTWWMVLLAGLVIACPMIAAWVLLGGLD